jgi:SdpC family antimicrobial peptide
MTFVLAATACGGGDPATAARKRLSGEEVFRGLVLGEGTVAEQFPEVWGSFSHRQFTLEEREAHERTKAQLVADIRQADPTFFDRFGAAMQSGDHLRIERAMDESAVLVKQAVQGRMPAAASRDNRGGTCVTFAIAANIAAVVNAIGAWNVAVTSNWVYNENYLWDDGGESAWSGSQLGRDQVIDMIATRLVTE